VNRERRRRTAASVRRIADASSLGLAFPIAIAIGYFFGRWLDGIFATSPWLTVAFGILGIVAGFVNAFRVAIRIGAEEDRDREAKAHNGDSSRGGS
jgi:F0F1-type ATP synthase assembly protein I